MTSFFIDAFFLKSPPKHPPYTGTLLPAVIHTFDFQVSIEEVETARLELLSKTMEAEVASMVFKGNTACSGLEPQRPQLIKNLNMMNERLKSLQEQIAHLQGQPFSSNEERTSQGPASVQAKALDKEQKQFKTAESKVKDLYRKIMMLTHEERHGKNLILREIFDLARLARKNNDVAGLAELLTAAQKYHQSASDRRRALEFLKQKRKSLSMSIDYLRTKMNEVKRSEPYKVHQLLTEGRQEEALSKFTNILENAREHLHHQINIAKLHIKDLVAQKG